MILCTSGNLNHLNLICFLDKTGQLLPEFDVVVKLEKYDTDDTVVIETNRNRVESPVKKKKTKPSGTYRLQYVYCMQSFKI